ncbi:MAG: hypothetical protein U1A24_05860 [Cypionkella sp.]|uniref:hypothetical protein n=1 Tax=Cypionkella sp. TaxID=2811411 RepID=UPI002ABAEA7D|nr:hypothetical protein [Cypionkella sp.]MDZ4310065.1 hypothetical protein [Cypionkella sp.]
MTSSTEMQSEARGIASRFDTFRKSDLVAIYEIARRDPIKLNLALRIFLRSAARRSVVEEYRIEALGEWLALSLPSDVGRFRTVAKIAKSRKLRNNSNSEFLEWIHPGVFDYFLQGLERGLQVNATKAPQNDGQKQIRYLSVGPEK